MKQLLLWEDDFEALWEERYNINRKLVELNNVKRTLTKMIESACTHPSSEHFRENTCPSSRGIPKVTCRRCGKDLTQRVLGQ